MIAMEKDIRAAQEALRDPKLDAAARKQHQLMVDATVRPQSGDIIPCIQSHKRGARGQVFKPYAERDDER